MNTRKSISKYLSFVAFTHTVFALPFAFIGFFLGLISSGSDLEILTLIMVVLCMVLARNAAMGFNRYADRKYDKMNPRTSHREIPAGAISPVSALIFILINVAGFITATFFINPLCFYLSPVAMIVVLGYSYTKRFTFLCHLILGLGLSLAPIGAYIAVTGYFAWLPVMFSAVVFFWVAGFDIFYALNDMDFDRTNKLVSIPSVLGIKNALIISALFHCIASVIIIYIGFFASFGLLYWLGASAFIMLLFYEHLIVKPSDLSKVNKAFATLNGIASLIFGILVIAELILKGIFEL